MSVLIDAEEIAKAKTGIPRVSFLDAIVFTQIFNSVGLYVSNQQSNSLLSSFEIRDLYEQTGSNREVKIEVISNRPRNKLAWILQTLGGIPLHSKFDFDYTYSALFPRMYRKSRRRTDIVRLHDPFKASKVSSYKELKGNSLKNVLARELRNSAFENMIISNCIFVANSYQTRMRFSYIYEVPESRFEVIWPSVGFRDQLTFHNSYPLKGENYLICVMSQRQRKDPLFVINNWSKIAGKIDLNLYVVGKIPIAGMSELAKRYMAEKRLRIFNSLSAPELEILQKGAFASIFASKGEGFGLPIAESLFYGVPVLHNDLEIFDEVCGGTGVTFSLESDDSIIYVLEELGKNHEKYQELRRKSWEIGARFSHENAAYRWLSTLDRHKK